VGLNVEITTVVAPCASCQGRQQQEVPLASLQAIDAYLDERGQPGMKEPLFVIHGDD
jgi:hypothetical protein